ncbi:bile acid:sodium symporter family protein [Oscillatoria amoena NRMC-F 0135]|nr:bile acid:sodium symporter family protein [Oscillatoria laete-virens]MDL5046525.1 bile acid:sodium symporter family protein [Oscillatoria amoena NRMC-F 0135]MDL5054859.1 bile acid:sodium symporter family protein [Oscillatoria laete-virens NRMC-F 0139]
MSRLLAIAANLFPLWVLLGAAVALIEPRAFDWYQAAWINPTLAIIMLGMGLTLSFDDFKGIGKMPRAVAIGFIAQYSVMPFMGWSVASLFNLPTPMKVGLILVSCCPGGTASNIVCYIARANVALSVTMTMCSTLAAAVMTPLLTKWLAGALVPVDAWKLFTDTFQVVVLPVIGGLLLNQFARPLVRTALPALPLIAVIGVVVIVAKIIGMNAGAVKHSGPILLAAVFTLHTGGFALGYLLARLLRLDIIASRTVSIEVGMQNSGLGVVLARNNFSDPLTAVPCAISSVFHSVIGSSLAGYWRIRKSQTTV